MARIRIPRQLSTLLAGSTLDGPVMDLSDRVGEILSDNKLPFFPSYTDHGLDHINSVLKSAAALVPSEVWEQSREDSERRLLRPEDACVLIGAVLLHDLAMHLRPPGFLELISPDTRFKPVSEFVDSTQGNKRDPPWHALWQDYVREARRFSEKDIEKILGKSAVLSGWTFRGLPEDTNEWDLHHELVIGEFIRRHHPRVAHEIALYGFPGLPTEGPGGMFPAIAQPGAPAERVADLIGITARSHGHSLRVCQAYLDSNPIYSGGPLKRGVAALYLMAVLRVADYLQLERKRAPAVLLQLREPQSLVSVEEWKKHEAVVSIDPGIDPSALEITVDSSPPFEIYWQLKKLLKGLQDELDHSAAVLAEVYGPCHHLGLEQLRLKYHRIKSNLERSSYQEKLPYEPIETGITVAPGLAGLLVEPLYGNYPEVGFRELIQNALDAVRELQAWRSAKNDVPCPQKFPLQDCDVLVELVDKPDEDPRIRISDKGIGMKWATISDYFLCAGSSYRTSSEWESSFVDDDGIIATLRSGRFGIGVFAAFLLGNEVRIQTRHVSESIGHHLSIAPNSLSVELNRSDNLAAGTTIEILDLNFKVPDLDFDPGDWYHFQEPSLRSSGFPDPPVNSLLGVRREELPLAEIENSPRFTRIEAPGFDAVYWNLEKPHALGPDLSCNGIRILRPSGFGIKPRDLWTSPAYKWPLSDSHNAPGLVILDREGTLPLTIQRYEFTRELPFLLELAKDVVLSTLAHALVVGPSKPVVLMDEGAFSTRHPLAGPELQKTLRWYSDNDGFVFFDPSLCPLVGTSTRILYGTVRLQRRPYHFDLKLEPSTIFFTRKEALTRYNVENDSFDFETRVEESGSVLTEKSFLGFSLQAIMLGGLDTLFETTQSARLLLYPFASDVELDLEDASLHEPFQKEGPIGTRYFETTFGDSSRTGVLQALFSAIDLKNLPYGTSVYCAEITPLPGESGPPSAIAGAWLKHIGARPIPFRLSQREALVEEMRSDPELGRHIEIWEALGDGSQAEP